MDDLVPVVIAGAAGAFVKELATQGVEWLTQLVGSHSHAVQEQVQRNARNFIVRLAERVQRLEEEFPTDQREIFDAALGHPGSSLLIQKALISASITDRDERHSILSELIAQRLAAEAEDMVALAGGAACDVVSALSARHIRLLGVMAHLFFVNSRPPYQENAQEEYLKDLAIFWNELESLCRPIDFVHWSDLLHLAGLSCIVINRGAARDLELTLTPWNTQDFERPNRALLEQQPWWAQFHRIWVVGLQNVFLTSTGLVIGVLFRDGELKKYTRIEFDKFY